MKILKKILAVATLLLLIPTMASANIAVAWNATSTDAGFITPNPVNGNIDAVKAPYFFATSSTASTLTGGLILPAITGTTCLQAIAGVVSGTGLACGSGGGGGGSFPFTATTNYAQVVYATSTPTLWFQSGLFASSTSQVVTLAAAAGSVGTPSLQVAGGEGLYQGGVNILSLSNGSSGISWDGTNFYPNSSGTKNLGILSTNLWNHGYINYASTTSITSTAQAYLSTVGYPQVAVGTTTSNLPFNITLDGTNEGNFATIGVENGQVSGFSGADVVDSFNGISGLYDGAIAKTNSPLMLGTNNQANCGLYDDNTLDTLFDCYAPSSGDEMTYTQSLPVGAETYYNDYTLMNYAGSPATGLNASVNISKTQKAGVFPTYTLDWRDQFGNANTYPYQTAAYSFFAASTTEDGAFGTTTAVAIGDVGIPNSSGELINPTGATLQVIASSTRANALTIQKDTAGTLTTDFLVTNAGTASSSNVIDSALTSGNCVQAGANGILTSAASACGSGGGGSGFPFTAGNTYNQVVYSTTTPTLWFKNGLFASSTIEATGINNVGSLNVYPTSEASSYYFIQGDGSGGLQQGAYNTDFVSNKIDGNPLLLNSREANNVGIGATSTPRATLAVQGNELLSGNITSVANVTATGTLTLAALTGTQCLHEISGVVSGTGSDCGAGGGTNFWSTNGSNIFNNTGTNVGIATSSPWGKLSIGIPTYSTSAPMFTIGSSTSAGTTTAFMVDHDGNVGIATTTPQQSLSIGGNTPEILLMSSSANPAIVFSKSGGQNGEISGGANNLNFFGGTHSTTPDALINSSGFFGIATSTPWRALSVTGSSDLGNNALAGFFTGTTTATSTLGGGLNIATGCFAIANTCVGGGGSSQTLGQVLTTGNDGAGLSINDVATTTATVFMATSTTATSTFAGNAVFATSTPTPLPSIAPAFGVSPSTGYISESTTSQATLLNLGTDNASASTTISLGKLQFDGYNSAGTRSCVEVVGTAWVITAGACNP